MVSKNTTAFIFPGQGSQKVGMAKEFAENSITAPLFEQANDVLNFDLADLMLSGDETALTQTQNAQPALLLASWAALTYLTKQSGKKVDDMASYVAGHSLGEYTALCAAGVLKFEDALKLVRIRGEAMADAVREGEGAMAAFLGLSIVDSDSIARNVGCWVANDNCEGQAVVAGFNKEVDEASNLAVMQDAKKVIRLDVSAPFHTPLMDSAANRMREEFENATFNTPTTPIVFNTTAGEEADPEVIKSLMVEQVTTCVRWRESMQYLAQKGITNIYELGSGKVLTGLAKRCDERLKATSLQTPQDIDAMLESLATEGAA